MKSYTVEFYLADMLHSYLIDAQNESAAIEGDPQSAGRIESNLARLHNQTVCYALVI